ncbi:MAG: preprotein translocase subunit YajC [bacterium]
MDTIAYAAGSAATGTAGQEGGMSGLMSMFLPLIIIFFIFWLLLIRPQQKRVKKHQEFLSSLKKGDEVITSSGIFGRITGIADNAVTIEIADGVKIKVEKGHIAGYAYTNQPSTVEKVGNTGASK